RNFTTTEAAVSHAVFRVSTSCSASSGAGVDRRKYGNAFWMIPQFNNTTASGNGVSDQRPSPQLWAFSPSLTPVFNMGARPTSSSISTSQTQGVVSDGVSTLAVNTSSSSSTPVGAAVAKKST
ncbi:hypothetical protein V6N13_036352, partial [Hibiscus sabdariffa]